LRIRVDHQTTYRYSQPVSFGPHRLMPHIEVDPAAERVRLEKEVARQLPKLARRDFIKENLDHNGWLVQVKTLEDAVRLANELAPEHCEIILRNARKVSAQIRTAGALFVGSYSPTVLGDYVSGPSHVLPTGGAGVSFAGLTVDQFQRRTSVVEYSRTALKRAMPGVRKFAEIEGLSAHGASAEIRLKAKG